MGIPNQLIPVSWNVQVLSSMFSSLHTTEVSIVRKVRVPWHHKFLIDYGNRELWTAHNVKEQTDNEDVVVLSTAIITVENEMLGICVHLS